MHRLPEEDGELWGKAGGWRAEEPVCLLRAERKIYSLLFIGYVCFYVVIVGQLKLRHHPSLDVFEEPSKRRLEIAFNL